MIATVNPAVLVRPADAPRFSTFRAAPGRYALLIAASKVGSARTRETAETLMAHFQDAPLPDGIAERINGLAMDVADLLDAWADNSDHYHANPTDALALAMVRWAGNKLAAIGAIPSALIDPTN